MDSTTGIFFWGFLIMYGIVMFLLSPKTVSLGGFFKGEDKQGRAANPWMITASIFIAWIFAKSVTNAANMGANFGIVGGIGYAMYWLCIPLTGWALYRLRRKFKATGMISFLTEHYGIAAAFCFSAAILVRLFNEVWSNTSVVGAYYGASGSAPFVIAALLFTAITVGYCCWGGMRGSIITDVAQAILFAVLLIAVLVWVVPMHDLSDFGRGRQFAAVCSGSGHGITAALPQAEKLCIRLCPDPAGRLHNMGGGSGQYPPTLAGAVRSQIVHQCGLSAAAHQRNNMSLLRKKRKNFFVDHFCFSATAMAIFSGVMGSS